MRSPIAPTRRGGLEEGGVLRAPAGDMAGDSATLWHTGARLKTTQDGSLRASKADLGLEFAPPHAIEGEKLKRAQTGQGGGGGATILDAL